LLKKSAIGLRGSWKAILAFSAIAPNQKFNAQCFADLPKRFYSGFDGHD
jgi:hypothetical protein